MILMMTLTLMTLIYLGCILAAIKIIKIKITPVSVAVSAVIGGLLFGAGDIAWKFSAPITGKMTVTRAVVPLLVSQNTKEVIKKIHVSREQLVKKGDLLYEVEKAPFQYAVDQQTAALDGAKQNITALEAAVNAAASRVEQARASLAGAGAELKVTTGMRADDAGAVSELQFTVDQYSYASAQAAVAAAAASQTSATFALEGARNGLPATEAQLRIAQLELDRAETRAPADGYVVNWQADEGTMGVSVIVSAQGAFMDMSETKVVAVYRQNLLKNVAAGDTVEIAFKSFPGYLATGTVDAVLEYTGEGQLMSSGVLPAATTIGSKGFLAVRITLDDESFASELPLGGAGTTAIYTKFGKPFHVIAKIVIRMKAWLYNLPV
jgi:multidrug resistance efflux pump